MITLIVGRPRTGKTYYLVVLLLERLQRLFPKRQVVSNVRGHVGVKHPISFQDDFIDRKYDKSLIILDEVQFYSVRDKSGEMFRHFTVHGHQERDYVWITQSTAALPVKWLGLVERTIKIETVAGSQISRALHYVGAPMRGDEPIETETFRPRSTDLYKTVEDGMSPPKRKMPSKVLFLFFAALFFVVAAPMGGYFMITHFINKTTVLNDVKKPVVPSDSSFITSAHASVPSVSPVPSVPPVPKNFSLAKGSKLYHYDNSSNHIDIDEGYNVDDHLIRYPLSVDDAIRLFDKPSKTFFSCNRTKFSDTKYFKCK